MIGDGLGVEVYPEAAPRQRVTAQTNHSGVFVVHHLPGLSGFEQDERDDPWDPAPLEQRVVVEVTDAYSRYLPIRFVAMVPHRGLWTLADLGLRSPPWDWGDAIPLFPAPGRGVPPGFGVIRAQIRRAGSGAPSAWALAEVIERGRRRGRPVAGLGMADQEGRLTIMAPYPAPGNLSLDSPPGGGPQLLTDQRWPFSLKVWDTFDPTSADRADLDRLLSLLDRVSDGLTDGGSPGNPVDGADLLFDREVILPERSAGDFRPRELYLTPAGSPP